MQTHGTKRAAKLLGVSESTVRRWRDGDFHAVKKSTKKLANRATKARRELRDYARSHRAKPITGAGVVPKARRTRHRDYSKLGQPIPGEFYKSGPRKGQPKRYKIYNLPSTYSNTVSHAVKGLDIADVALLLQALRDRGAKFRLVYQTPRGDTRYPSRQGGTPPLDPEGMSDEELDDWLNDALKGGSYKPTFIMEMEPGK